MIPADQLTAAARDNYLANLERALARIDGIFDSAWIVDHLQFGRADVLESFTTLAWVAARCPRLRVGHAVLCQSFRNPALLAKMGANLHFLSGGRFILGLGAGWHEEEYRAYGYDFPPPGVRVSQLEETLQIVHALWSGEHATIDGTYHRIDNAVCIPAPDPRPPIMIGAFRPRMLGLTARYADWWNVSSTGPNAYMRMSTQLDDACARIGRDPATVKRTWCGGCACAASESRARDLAGDRFSAEDEDDFGFVGTPDQVVEQMERFIALGVETFMVDCAGFPELETLDLLIEHVLPRLHR